MAALRTLVMYLLCLMVGYHGYANAAVTCSMLDVGHHSQTEACAEMGDAQASDGDECCCASTAHCCAKFMVPFAPLPAVTDLASPAPELQDWTKPITSFSSHTPAVPDPPPRP